MLISLGARQELVKLEAHRELLTEMFGRISSQEEPSLRLTFLLASVLKLLRMQKAIGVLAREEFVEEILALNRTMSEVVINAAYFQFAEDEEIERFQHFETQCMFKHAERLRQHISNPLRAAEQKKLEAVVEEARSVTGRRDSDPSWSSRNISLRAAFSDNLLKSNLMTRLVLISYAHGHSAVHSTFDALMPFIKALNAQQAMAEEARAEDLYVAISSVNFVLSTMCFYLDCFFRLGLSSEITQAGTLRMRNSGR